MFSPCYIQLEHRSVFLRFCSVCLRVVTLTAKANKVIEGAFAALAAKYDMMNIAPVFAADYATIPVSFNRLPLRLAEQFPILLSVLVHSVNALSTLQPLLSL